MPEMRPVTIRFGDSLWSLIEDEANQDGVSAAHWIRDACLARALWERRRRDVPDGLEVLTIMRHEMRLEDEARQKLIRDALATSRKELETIISQLPPDSAKYLRELGGL